MKHLTYLLTLTVAATLLLSSCVENSSTYKKLEEKYDSLLMISNKADENLEEMLSIINEVEQNFQDIKEAENFVTVKQRSGELNANTREQIRNNMKLISETLQNNREQLNKLNEELKKNTIKSKSLAAKIARMTKQLEERETELSALRATLVSKDLRINELDSTVMDLSRNVEDLTATRKAQEEVIKDQDSNLHTGFYCFGTISELKEQKILAGGGLLSSLKVLPEGFNKDYFLRVDIRELSSLPLLAPKARVRTQHPSKSYDLIKGSDGNMTLKILDAKEFWSLSKYLVVEVNPK